MKKIILLALLLVFSYLLYKFGIVSIPFTKEDPSETSTSLLQPFQFKANVQYIKGSAWNLIDGRKVEIKENDVLSRGAEIQTDKETYVVFSLDDGSVIRVGPETTVKLVDLISNDIVIENIKGTVFSRVNKDKDHLFTVKADSFNIRAMGTVFSVENLDDVKVNVYESTVVVDDEKGSDTQVSENNKWEESSLKVSEITESDIAENTFDTWSLKEEKIATKLKIEQKEEPKEESPKVDDETTGIILSGKKTDSGIYLEWSVNGSISREGYKILKSSDENPSFPEDGYVYVKESSANHYTVSVKDGKIWHFRVCAYSGGKCSLYSNDIEMTAPEGAENSNDTTGEVKSLTLKVNSVDDGKVKLSWTVDGYSERGYKLVYSKNDKPTYPLGDGDKYIYNSDPDDKDVTVDNLSDGKYYFRVCEYLGGKCGVYSNQVTVDK